METTVSFHHSSLCTVAKNWWFEGHTPVLVLCWIKMIHFEGFGKQRKVGRLTQESKSLRTNHFFLPFPKVFSKSAFWKSSKGGVGVLAFSVHEVHFFYQIEQVSGSKQFICTYEKCFYCTKQNVTYVYAFSPYEITALLPYVILQRTTNLEGKTLQQVVFFYLFLRNTPW